MFYLNFTQNLKANSVLSIDWAAGIVTDSKESRHSWPNLG